MPLHIESRIKISQMHRLSGVEERVTSTPRRSLCKSDGIDVTRLAESSVARAEKVEEMKGRDRLLKELRQALAVR
jgi:hypothetical protein